MDIKITILLFISKIIYISSQICQKRVRKEIRELNTQEMNQFHYALRQMKKLGIFDNFCKVHLQSVAYAHGSPYFFPWHREFINNFEIELRKINPRLSLPYWDWSIDSQFPETSIVFDPNYFGGNGIGANFCVAQGPYTFWSSFNPRPHCLTRSFNLGNRMSPFYSPALLAYITLGSFSFQEFHLQMEGAPHAAVHVNIGGDMGTMASCNDPIFYLHHAFMDKMWWEWQQLRPENMFNFHGIRVDGLIATYRDNMYPFNVPVLKTLNINENYCYFYSNDNTLALRKYSENYGLLPYDNNLQFNGIQEHGDFEPGRLFKKSLTGMLGLSREKNRRVAKPLRNGLSKSMIGDKNTLDIERMLPMFGRGIKCHKRMRSIPDYWISLNKLSQNYIRNQETEISQQIVNMNKMYGDLCQE